MLCNQVLQTVNNYIPKKIRLHLKQQLRSHLKALFACDIQTNFMFTTSPATLISKHHQLCRNKKKHLSLPSISYGESSIGIQSQIVIALRPSMFGQKKYDKADQGPTQLEN